jgi:hypothetical protein
MFEYVRTPSRLTIRFHVNHLIVCLIAELLMKVFVELWI